MNQPQLSPAARTGGDLQKAAVPGGVFNAPVFSPDGQSLLGICSDHTARRWDVETGRESVRFEGHTSGITAALHCDDDDRVWTSSEDGSVRAWNVQDGSELATFDHPGPVRELWVAASGSRVVSHWRHRLEDGSLKAWATVWDTETGRELTRIELPLQHIRIAVRPQSTHVLIASQEHGSRLFDVETGDIVGNYVRDGFSKRSQSDGFLPIGVKTNGTSLQRLAKRWPQWGQIARGSGAMTNSDRR